MPIVNHRIYVTDTDDVVHLMGSHPAASRTLCGIRRNAGRLTLGDETLSGLAATCPACQERGANLELAPSHRLAQAAQGTLERLKGARGVELHVYTALDVDHAGIVTEPDVIFLTRELVLKRNDEARQRAGVTAVAYVVHRTDGTWAAFAD